MSWVKERIVELLLEAGDMAREARKKLNILEEVVVIGDARPRLGCIYFLREGVEKTASREEYLGGLVREFNASRPVDQQLGPWTVSVHGLKESGGIGPSGKLVRRRIEEQYGSLYAAADG